MTAVSKDTSLQGLGNQVPLEVVQVQVKSLLSNMVRLVRKGLGDCRMDEWIDRVDRWMSALIHGWVDGSMDGSCPGGFKEVPHDRGPTNGKALCHETLAYKILPHELIHTFLPYVYICFIKKAYSCPSPMS